MTTTQIRELKERNIVIVNSDIQGHQFICMVFDFDGTVSLLREQWRRVMAQTMVEVISGETESSPEIQKEVERYIEESAGIQTIYQMRHLVGLVNKYGLVPTDEVLTAEEYKEIYDHRLFKVVSEQLTMLEEDDLTRQDLTVPGVIDFLNLLRSCGVVLYVASGTDRKYVLREATALGVAHYFQGIYAPDPTLPDYSKSWLVRKVIEWHNLTPGELLVVGDGPVEIVVAKKQGSFALGVASTEKPEGGLNSTKRQVLLEAGADIIVPDFSDYRLLVDYLFSGHCGAATGSLSEKIAA